MSDRTRLISAAAGILALFFLVRYAGDQLTDAAIFGALAVAGVGAVVSAVRGRWPWA